MRYIISFGKRFRKRFRTLQRSGVFNIVEKLDNAIESLRNGQELHISFKDHALQGKLSDYREFHLSGDLLVLYKLHKELGLIEIVSIGSHDDFF